MTKRIGRIIPLALAAVLLLVDTSWADEPAQYYGGIGQGPIFEMPEGPRLRDARLNAARLAARNAEVPFERLTAPGEDPYDPRAWLAEREPGRNRPALEPTPHQAQHASFAQPLDLPSVRKPAQRIHAPQGPEYVDAPQHSGEYLGPEEAYGGYDGYDDGYDGHGCHDGGTCGRRQDCCHRGCSFDWLFSHHKEVEIFAGVHGFKGPPDDAGNGNFGFQEGFNLSEPIPFFRCWDLGYQFGMQAVQSNLSGTSFNEDSRDQVFITAGIFKRKECGLQWGIAWDWLHDDYHAEVDLAQVRTEISLVNQCGHEIGFWGAFGTGDDATLFDEQIDVWEPTDQYVFFYRWQFDCCADARLWGGVSGSGDGIVGGDARIPLNDHFSLSLAANYLIPEEDAGPEGAGNESWNLGINLVWRFGCGPCYDPCSPYRPMFSVADNGTFFVERSHRQFRNDTQDQEFD